MSAKSWGWNARWHSFDWIAVEFAQALQGLNVDDQIDVFCEYVRSDVIQEWPEIPRVVVLHSELDAGIKDGKSDTFARGTAEAEAFKARVLAALASH